MDQHVFIASSTFAREDKRPLDILTEQSFKVAHNLTGKRLEAAELIRQAAGADAVIAGLEIYDARVLEALPRLKCISRCGVGVDNIDLAAAKERGVRIYNTPDVVIQPVAEITLAMIFDLLRRLTFHTELMRCGKWERLMGMELKGSVVGVVGLGRIGRRVAELLRRLEADVWGYDIAPDHVWAKVMGVKIVTYDELLKGADILTLHLALDGANPFCLGAEAFGKMKAGALLVNVARGMLVDEIALASALSSGHIAAAALDVYAREPYQGPLCGLPNVVLTPHVGTLTQGARAAMEMAAAHNVRQFFLNNV
ncbi:MAG: hypothetical protein HQL19_01880 [Candidatus Omnitrophica bacterium]|nr:hypothetical protein [Candidatus Omnitrophota bacterium]